MDWIGFVAGIAIGLLASGLFFAGLGISVRLAMRSKRPGSLLLVSAGLRITLLLLAGWGATRIGLWSLAGFAAGFLVVRLTTISWVRAAIGQEVS